MEPINKESGGASVVDGDVALRVKQPKRILHFSDGIVEEFSDDDDRDATDAVEPSLEVDESQMTWGPWMWHKATTTGNTVLAGCDYAGEYLASFLGITTPKFSYEIEQYKKAVAEREAAAKEDAESANWTEVKQLNETVATAAVVGDGVVSVAPVTNQTEVNKY